jgi:NADH-quinone oxidoreductase subunit E/NADH dehydrogenase (ubiquinone) flavoprotein 2
MNQPLPPETHDEPLAPGQRLPVSDRKSLSPEAVAEIKAIASRYPDPLAGTLPGLYIAQREFGFLSLEAMREVARALGAPEAHVKEFIDYVLGPTGQRILRDEGLVPTGPTQ